jgi:hypothetical protein
MKHTIPIILAALVLAGCSNMMTQKTAEDRDTALVTIRLGVSGETAALYRTIIPGGISESSRYYSLCFTQGAAIQNETLDAGLTTTVDLGSGIWDLQVYGYPSAADRDAGPSKAILAGTVTGIPVSSGSPSAVTVDLAAAADSTVTGTFRYAIQFPNTVSYAVLTISDPTGGSAQSRNILGAEGGNTLTPAGSNNIAAGEFSGLSAGYYRLGLELYDEVSGVIAAKSEILHIYGGMISTADGAAYTFVPADFADEVLNLVPYATDLPTTLTNILSGPAGEYAVVLSADETCPPMNLETTGNKEFVITIRGNGHTLDLTTPGTLFTIGGTSVSWKVTLALRDITLRGRNDNTGPLVLVQPTGVFTMNSGAVITGNTSANGSVHVNEGAFTMNSGEISGNTTPVLGSAKGIGVSMSGAGTFTMNGWEISGNTYPNVDHAPWGGGVYIGGTGTFTMKGGEISGNTAGSGGGVFIDVTGTFIMNSGEISGNTSKLDGGGVFGGPGTFTMNGGKISGNGGGYTGGVGGGGVSIGNYNTVTGTFTMSGGEISGNSGYRGGGVVVYGGGTFTMIDGEISGNEARDFDGGGVAISGTGAFAMSGGEISGNTAAYGGGVGIMRAGTFIMSGGEISGNHARMTIGGGGVCVGTVSYSGDPDTGTFTMSGGEISGNTASFGGGISIRSGTFTMSGGEVPGNTASIGGGVFVDGTGEVIFTKQSGGIIYGADGGGLKNTATNSGGGNYGHAAYVQSLTNPKWRSNTAGIGNTMDSAVDGAPGGWD